MLRSRLLTIKCMLHRNLGDTQQSKEYYQRAQYIILNKLGPDHAKVTKLSLLFDVQRVLDFQQQAPDAYDRTQKRGPDQTDLEFANCKRRR